jgi:seryl-tRNA synthetase
MIDLRAARSDPDAYRAALARKNAAFLFDELLAVDARWREVQQQVDELRAQSKPKGKPTPEQLEQLKAVKERLGPLETELADVKAQLDDLLERVPNPPAEDTPDGTSEDDAAVVKLVGEPPPFDFEPRDHLDLAAAHGWIDAERGAKVSGSRFVYRVGDLALVELALYQWALRRLVQKGHVPVLPPVLVRDRAMYGTGFFPSDKGDFYEVPEDELYLVGTSEVPVAAFHGGEILDELPLRYVAFSTCFRREAGAAGRDTRGMFRVHQFDKVEMFVFCEPERSRDEHERLLAIEEELVQELELPYRVLNIAAGDLGSSAAKKYDIEAWFPGQSRYREITSTSNTTGYQARRLDIRFRRDGKLEHVHTLNGTAVTARALIAILENFQDADGSVAVAAPRPGLGAAAPAPAPPPRLAGGPPPRLAAEATASAPR